MDALPTHASEPSRPYGLDKKPGLQPKQQQRKAKLKQSRWPPNTAGLTAPVDELNKGVASEQVADNGGSGVSVISALQEFVQDSKTFRMPSKHSILQWQFEECCTNVLVTEFRATVIFVLEGIPHHTLGEWRTSKNLAKRSAAEAALALFVGQWGDQLSQEHASEYKPLLLNASKKDNAMKVDALFDFCKQFPPCQQTQPELTCIWEENSCKVLVDITLFGVPHTFAGNPCEDEDAARADISARVLWYLQCPGFADSFEVDMEALAERAQDFTASASYWPGNCGG